MSDREESQVFKDNFISRFLILIAIYLILLVIVMYHFFNLQIVNGESYQDSYTIHIVKNKTLSAARGNIYDRNGNVLAYNELSYTITIEDNGTYENSTEKNKTINDTILFVLHTLDDAGDEMTGDFEVALENGEFTFNVSGSRQERFLADIYGKNSYSELGSLTGKLGYNPSFATADRVMEYLCDRFGVDETLEINDRYRIAVIRYRMSLNSYKKYISTDIASNVSERTVAVISEHMNELQGVEIAEDTIRRYNDAKYFASIIGYTGRISESEYEKLSAEDDSYSLTDVVGKSGVEQYMDRTLKGTKGLEKVYVDVLGKELDTLEYMEPTAGNNVYLSIDSELQKACYSLLEQEIAGILYSKIVNSKTYESKGSSDIMIPIYDVYNALINNNVISISSMGLDTASSEERRINDLYLSYRETVMDKLEEELTGDEPGIYSELPEDMAVYESYVVSLLQNNGVYDTEKIKSDDPTYSSWKNDEITLQDYLRFLIREQWIDVTKLEIDSRYSDSEEVYDVLVQYLRDALVTDNGFSKRIYRFMIKEDIITGVDLALILYAQQFLSFDDEMIDALRDGSVSAYDFFMEKIADMEITPAELALDPCTGSVVMTDPASGELLACVSYPGYDNNRLANVVDAAYYNKLSSDLSSPFYNHATQEKTAPGSTFKMVIASAGLTEGVIDTNIEIRCDGIFTKVENGPKCWKYPSNHGEEKLVEAIRDSCNAYFYEVGWRLSQKGENYDEKTGIEKIEKYASLFGLNEKTGVEIVESEPQIATEYPITASIGQSNNNYTTISLSRYITAVASKGNVYKYTVLSKVTDSAGRLLEDYSPEVMRRITEITPGSWRAIQKGNREVCRSMESFDKFFDEYDIEIAGKTGTAQQVVTRPNHALFLGYAPYNSPKVTIATRIAYGYTSHNTADLAADILEVYFGTTPVEEMVTGRARNVSSSANSVTD